jgi:glycine cleavage system H protein
MNKENLKYTKTHEWIYVEGNTATVGVTDFAQNQMGDIVFVDLPKLNTDLVMEKQACVIESVKSAFDIYSPASGEVVEINKSLNDDPALINKDPFGNGWIFKMKLSNSDELNSLMDFKSYEEFCNSQQH